jgi:uncharacterized protein (DUF1778 family)
VGLSLEEAETLDRAAELCATPRATFIRDAALYHAEQLIEADKKGRKR